MSMSDVLRGDGRMTGKFLLIHRAGALANRRGCRARAPPPPSEKGRRSSPWSGWRGGDGAAGGSNDARPSGGPEDPPPHGSRM